MTAKCGRPQQEGGSAKSGHAGRGSKIARKMWTSFTDGHLIKLRRPIIKSIGCFVPEIASILFWSLWSYRKSMYPDDVISFNGVAERVTQKYVPSLKSIGSLVPEILLIVVWRRRLHRIYKKLIPKNVAHTELETNKQKSNTRSWLPVQSVVRSLYYRSLRSLATIGNISVGFISLHNCNQPRISHGFRVTWAQMFVTLTLTVDLSWSSQDIVYADTRQTMVGFSSILNCNQPRISHGFRVTWAKIFVTLTLTIDPSRSSQAMWPWLVSYDKLYFITTWKTKTKAKNTEKNNQ